MTSNALIRQFVIFLPPGLEAGANFIGGCCGTSPDFICEIKKLLRGKTAP